LFSIRTKQALEAKERGFTPELVNKHTKNTDMNTYRIIYQVVCQIPKGKVATYGQVAELANLYGKARLVGYALYRVDRSSDIPWHRVINAKGEISYSTLRYGGDDLQRALLEREGIKFSREGKINLRKYLWKTCKDKD
jgi:methylated-DNA-protein-cysteine methyltransferase-like protein